MPKPIFHRIYAVLWLLFLFNTKTFSQDQLFSISLDNDVLNLFNQTDRYYTNGVNIGFYHNQLKKSIFNKILIGSENHPISSTGITFHQGIYTPINLIDYVPSGIHRPYASVALLSQERIDVNPTRKYKVISSVGLGVIGNYAGGAMVQNFIHSLTPHSDSVIGWDNQIINDFIIDYKIGIEKGIVDLSFVQLHLLANAQLGTYQDNLFVGMRTQIGLLEPYYASSFGRSMNKTITLNLFGEVNYGYMFYNASLEGGVFNNRKNESIIPSQLVNRERVNYSFGMQLNYKRISLEAGRVWQNPEFTGAESHAWGYLKFSWYFGN